MGNTIRRTFANERSTSIDWSETNVLRLISEKKLAPKTSNTSSKNNEECPICFLEFDLLNSANCCKQSICTDCVVQLKHLPSNSKSKSIAATVNTSCPFCGKKDFEVYFNDTTTTNNSLLVENKLTSSTASNKILSPIRINNSNNNNCTYITPEQERKLRSHSIDTSTVLNTDASKSINTTSTTINTTTTTTNNNNTLPTPPVSIIKSASKSDRIALEEQMKSQRLQYSTEYSNDEIYTSTSNHRNNNINIPPNRSARHNSYSVRIPYRHNSRNSSRVIYGSSSESISPPSMTTTTQQSATLSSATAATRTALNHQFFHSIQDILGSTGVHDISSIEQLEELMLMEAIRQSMHDSAPNSPQQSTINTTATTTTTTNNNNNTVINNNTTTDPTTNELTLDDIHIEDTDTSHTETVIDTADITHNNIISNHSHVHNHLDSNNTNISNSNQNNVINSNINNYSNNQDLVDNTNDDFFNSDDDAEDEELKIALALSMVDFSSNSHL